MTAEKSPGPPRSEETAILSWRVHPAARSPRKTVAVGLIIAGLVAGSAWYAGVALGVVACALLCGSLWPFFMPTTYRLTASAVEQVRWPTRQRRPWSAFRRFEADGRGVLLSPFPHPSRLDPFRGMYLLTAPEIDITRVLRDHVGPDEAGA
ncbi:MAG: hypothetical protein MUE60_01380 [Candidatus Eisenbacteria bacterium]|nr:hypothetical protein [Candidatus Eisenbacteria bacterium]